MVCISPLTSLMMDQKAKFIPRGVVTEFVGGSQEDQSVIDNVHRRNGIGKDCGLTSPQCLS